jgi:O-6-methylguanine DNA methyltransferase
LVNTHSTGKITLALEPLICVHFACQASTIHTISFSSSSAFSYVISGADALLEKQLVNWLLAYTQKKTLPFDMHIDASDFRFKVFNYLRSIPFGVVKSYKQVAEAIKHPNAARAVGSACKNNSLPLIIPCHRIIQANGLIGGFSPIFNKETSLNPNLTSISSLDLKRCLLQFEGSFSTS